jgi:hypothetical protein
LKIVHLFITSTLKNTPFLLEFKSVIIALFQSLLFSDIKQNGHTVAFPYSLSENGEQEGL